MFSLIVTLIAIALVGALALATLYYGGPAFNKGSEAAKLAGLLNESTQVQGAAALYRAENSGAGPATVADLVANDYLKTALTSNGTSWSTGGGFATTTTTSLAQCTAFNAKYGITGVPACSGDTITGPHCCL